MASLAYGSNITFRGNLRLPSASSNEITDWQVYHDPGNSNTTDQDDHIPPPWTLFIAPNNGVEAASQLCSDPLHLGYYFALGLCLGFSF